MAELTSLGYASIAAEDPKALQYKPSGPTPGVKAGTAPWASKRAFSEQLAKILFVADLWIANNMANGKDFFTELRKQVSTLQQANERAGG